MPHSDQAKVSKGKMSKLMAMNERATDGVNRLGAGYKARIYREFLGIEPPEGYDRGALR